MVDSNSFQQYYDAQTQLRCQLFQNLPRHKTMQTYLNVLDGLNQYLITSGKAPSEAMSEYYKLITKVQPFEKPPTTLLRMKARPLLMLNDVLNGEGTKRRYSYNQKVCPESFSVELKQYCKWMAKCEKSEGTIRTRSGRIRVFFHFLVDNECYSIESISVELVIDFIGHLSNKYSSQGKTNILYTLKNFFSCPDVCSRLSINPRPLLKGLHSRKHERLGSYYTTEEIKKVMESIDRATKSGKTIYLIMLLACVYGLRVSDIRELELSSLHWKRNTIGLFQYKTKNYIELPLIQSVCLALLDYLRNVRPNVQDPHVFIKHRCPHEPYSTNVHFGSQVSEVFSIAGINTYGKHHGLHALRHSLASWLMEADTNIHEVAVILGHTTVATTKNYIWSDIAHLKSAALEVPPYDQ